MLSKHVFSVPSKRVSATLSVIRERLFTYFVGFRKRDMCAGYFACGLYMAFFTALPRSLSSYGLKVLIRTVLIVS